VENGAFGGPDWRNASGGCGPSMWDDKSAGRPAAVPLTHLGRTQVRGIRQRKIYVEVDLTVLGPRSWRMVN
jgi:hypothetical protein